LLAPAQTLTRPQAPVSGGEKATVSVRSTFERGTDLRVRHAPKMHGFPPPVLHRGRGHLVCVAACNDVVMVATSRGYVLRYQWDAYGNEKGELGACGFGSAQQIRQQVALSTSLVGTGGWN